MWRLSKFYVICIAAGALISAACATPPEVDANKDLPRFPVVEPQDAVKTMVARKGFHVDLVAAEPQIQSPVAICFDENGRMFVAEMIGYSERFNEHVDRVVMLEDTHGNGVYDKSTVFAEGLLWPTGLFWANGGLYVVTTPNLYFFKDTNGDGKADIKQLVYSGFGFGTARKVEGMQDVNVQGVVNGFNWGLDNKIHVETAPNGGIITNLVAPTQSPVNLDGRNFAFDQRTMLIEPEAGGGQFGMSFDTRGRKFTCSNADHVDEFMYEARYGGRNHGFAMPPSLLSIGLDGAAAEVFRISPEEPWRVLRTQWRVAGVASGPVEGGGRSSGYFTGASGIAVYRGNAFPPEFLDNTFVSDVAFNIVHRDVLTASDMGVTANRAPDEQTNEFLASRDTWFRPTLMANAPDGALYVVDMHREIIEHPWSLPEQLKKHLDLNSGNDRGRIFRVAPDGFKIPAPPHLGSATTPQLVALLDHPNGWHRDTAQRLLYERQDAAAIPLLQQMLTNGSRLGRLHALHTLDGLYALDERELLTALSDPDWTMRAHAIELTEKFRLNDGQFEEVLWDKIRRMAADPSSEVRYQLAFTLGETADPERVPILAQILRSDPSSAWMRAAVLSSLREGSAEMFDLLGGDAAFCARPAGREFLGQLAELIGTKNNAADVSTVFNFLMASPSPEISFGMANALAAGLKRAGSWITEVDKTGKADLLFIRALKSSGDTTAPEAVRLQAIQLLGWNAWSIQPGPTDSTLLLLLNPPEAIPVQLAAVKTLEKLCDTNIGAQLVNRMPTYPPEVKSEVISSLLSRSSHALDLLEGIKANKLSIHDLTTAQITFLRLHHPDKNVRAAALRVFGPPSNSNRQQVISEYLSALNLKGVAARGRAIYLQRCSSCHRLAGQGHQLGPDLVTVKSSGKEKMLVNILDPNREVAPQFQAYEVELKDGESLIGIIVNQTDNSLTVRQAFGKEDIVMLSNIKRKKSQNQSLMPEGLEAGLKRQHFADLLEFISTAECRRRD